MMKIKHLTTLLLTISCLLPIDIMAQQKKLFTLEDLNFGGNNYRNLQPENLWLTWWGNQLMYQDAEEGGIFISKDKQEKLFSLVDVGTDFHSAYAASYPYADQPLVLCASALHVNQNSSKTGVPADHKDHFFFLSADTSK